MPFHKYFNSLFLLGFLFLIACQGFKFDPWPESPYGIHHTVQKGQTLYQIAQIYGLDMEVVRRANHILNASKIKVGDRLWIPGARRVLSVHKSSPHSGSKKNRTTKKKKTHKAGLPKGFLIWPAEGTLTSGFGKRNGHTKELILLDQKEQRYIPPPQAK